MTSPRTVSRTPFRPDVSTRITVSLAKETHIEMDGDFYPREHRFEFTGYAMLRDISGDVTRLRDPESIFGSARWREILEMAATEAARKVG
jgi:hypothetical protein